MNNKDFLRNFVPMTEEEQKDLLFAILDCMDYYAEKSYEVKTAAKKRQICDIFLAYEFIASFFLWKDWQRKVNYKGYKEIRNNAKRKRKEYEDKWAKA